MIWYAFRFGWGLSKEDLLLNLGTEIISIAITVAFVDWLLERQRMRDESRRIAWQALHELDHAMWVWQGGTRHFDFGELIWLISKIDDKDPLPEFTQNLIINLGSRADNTIRISNNIVKTSRNLEEALNLLSKLSSIRDDKSKLSNRDVSKILDGAVKYLGIVVQLSPVALNLNYDLISTRNPDIEYQEWRHFGDRPKKKLETG